MEWAEDSQGIFLKTGSSKGHPDNWEGISWTGHDFASGNDIVETNRGI